MRATVPDVVPPRTNFAQSASVSSLGPTVAICPGSHRSRASLTHATTTPILAQLIALRTSAPMQMAALSWHSRLLVRSKCQDQTTASTQAIRAMAHFGQPLATNTSSSDCFGSFGTRHIAGRRAHGYARDRPSDTLSAARSDAQLARPSSHSVTREGAAATNAASALTLARGPRTVDVTKDATASKVQENVLRRLAERRGPTVKWRRWPVCAGADLLLTAGPGDGIGECGCDL